MIIAVVEIFSIEYSFNCVMIFSPKDTDKAVAPLIHYQLYRSH